MGRAALPGSWHGPRFTPGEPQSSHEAGTAALLRCGIAREQRALAGPVRGAPAPSAVLGSRSEPGLLTRAGGHRLLTLSTNSMLAICTKSG